MTGSRLRMAPKSLTISKLAVEVSADDESARSLLCLKISIPRDLDGKTTGHWSLFGDKAPHLVSAPQIHSLPLSAGLIQQSGHVRTACTLLSLIADPTRVSDFSPSSRPTIEVNSYTGRVEISVDSLGSHIGRNEGSMSANSPGGGIRREFLVILEFDQEVEISDGRYQLAVPLSKCLDNNLRFQILPAQSSASSSSGEVSIVTEPKILPVSRSPRAVSSVPRSGIRRRSLKEDGWEDGESLGPEDLDSDSSEEESGASWLEGRFQSTDTLRLEWSYAITAPSYPSLHVTPSWHTRRPFIQVDYTASTSSVSSLGIEAEIPDGWGWSDLSIEGDGLVSWHCTDGQWWDPLLSSSSACPDASNSTEPDEDSFSTVRARRSQSTSSRTLPSLSRSSSGASLMRQPLPQPDPSFDEFSFELNNPPAPLTPASLRKRSMLGRSVDKAEIPGIVLSSPAPGCTFELVFADHMEGQDFRITGKLIPLSKTSLVSPSVPVLIPTFRLAGVDGHCHYHAPTHPPCLIDITLPPTLVWTDQQGRPIPLPIQELIKGDINISLKRLRGSTRSMTLTFPWPKNGVEVSMQLHKDNSGDGSHGVKLVKAIMNGRALPRTLIKGYDGSRVQIGRGEGLEGTCIVELEVDDEYFVHGRDLPMFEGAVGDMRLDLSEAGWNTSAVRTNLSHISPLTYSTSLPTTSPPHIQIPPPDRIHHHSHSAKPSSGIWGIWSWSTLINIFMLYLFLSLGQQLQRLHSQVAFISDENKDLRSHTTRLQEELGQYGQYGWERAGRASTSSNGETIYLERGELDRNDQGDTSIGRIVLDRSGWSWQNWIRHPTVTTLSTSLGWLWHTVLWLVHA